jgi:hypothetical protein
MKSFNSLINRATDLYGGTHKKVRRSVASTAQHIRNVARQDDEENFDEDGNDGDEERDGSMDNDEDDVEGRDDMNPANLFDEVSLSLLNFTCSQAYLKSLSRSRTSLLDAKVFTCLLLLVPP